MESSSQFDDLVRLTKDAADTGETAVKARLRLVMNGVDGHTADRVVQKVFNDLPLSERHRDAGDHVVDNICRAEGVGKLPTWAYFIGVGLLFLLGCLLVVRNFF